MQTPYYVIRKNILDELFFELKRALDMYWPNYKIGYSFKTNSLPWIVEYMKDFGVYAEVVSKDEYEVAKKLKFENKVIYNGPVKSKETFCEAVEKGCIINIDSKREVDWLIEWKKNNPEKSINSIGIRVNFDLERYCPGETQCGNEGGRFGFCYENGELSSVIGKLNHEEINISGLHLHCSSKTRSLNIYKAIARICCCIIEEYELSLEYVDIGGGFFGGVAGKPEFVDYISTVAEILKEKCSIQNTQLIVEPGMCLIGASMDYITSVVDVKDTTYNRFVLIDGSRTNIDPLMSKKTYLYETVLSEENRKAHVKQVVSGYTCMENDRLFIAEDEKEFKVGDQIIFKRVVVPVPFEPTKIVILFFGIDIFALSKIIKLSA